MLCPVFLHKTGLKCVRSLCELGFRHEDALLVRRLAGRKLDDDAVIERRQQRDADAA